MKVAGVDAAYAEDRVIACAVVLDSQTFALGSRSIASSEITFPYRPGFLALREGPVDFSALSALPPFDLLFVDGAGIAHPCRYGLAVYLGEHLQISTIGVTKSPFVGKWREPEDLRGAFSPLEIDGEIRGAVLRTRVGVKPLFVSPGYGLNVQEAIFWTLRMSRTCRQPEPLRTAHHLARLYLKDGLQLSKSLTAQFH